MKYKFNTLAEVKRAIEKWFKDCGYTGKERAGKQYLKIIAEVGEMADALCKEDHENFKSEAGDVFVTIVGYCLQTGEILSTNTKNVEVLNIPTTILELLHEIRVKDFYTATDYLSDICISQNTTLLECATIAYNKIQSRLESGQLKIINGTIQK